MISRIEMRGGHLGPVTARPVIAIFPNQLFMGASSVATEGRTHLLRNRRS
jgi:hypothetical protein